MVNTFQTINTKTATRAFTNVGMQRTKRRVVPTKRPLRDQIERAVCAALWLVLIVMVAA